MSLEHKLQPKAKAAQEDWIDRLNRLLAIVNVALTIAAIGGSLYILCFA